MIQYLLLIFFFQISGNYRIIKVLLKNMLTLLALFQATSMPLFIG